MTTFLKRPPRGIALRDLYTRPLAYGISPSSVRWDDGGTATAFLWNDHGEPLLDLYVYDGGRLGKLSDAASVPPLPVEDDERSEEEIAYAETMTAGVSGFDWLGDDLVYTLRGNLFKVDPKGAATKRITSSTQGWSSLQAAPDGRRVAFLTGGNLWTYDTVDGSLAQVTFFSRDQVAVTDFGWSPDSARFWVSVDDTSMYERVKMPDYSPEKEVKIVELRRNNVGKPLAKIRVGIVPSTGGAIARVRLAEPAGEKDGLDTGDEISLHGACWTPDSSTLVVSFADRDYVDYRIVAVKPGKENEPREIFKTRQEPWADWAPPHPASDSRHVCFAAYLEGWRRVYRLALEGGEPVPLSPDGIDVGALYVPKRGDQVYYTVFAPEPTELRLFRAPLQGGDPAEIPTAGTGCEASVSPDGRLAVVTSSVMKPGELYWPEDDPKPVTRTPIAKFDQLRQPKVERFSFTNDADGAVLHGKLILPANFDPSKRYPAILSCVYAGQGKEGFGRYQPLDTYMANELGYVIVGLDLRASPGYGRDFYFGYHKKLGLIDAEECVACANHLKSLPYIDGDRIGIWGGSYGGFLVLMALCNHPGVFHTGVSWKPVTDWRNYWDSYTAPRLGRPADDPEAYKATSPVFCAEGLADRLLIIHGMLDDNVLFQDAAWMIQKLVEAGKYFDLMIYPRDNHGLDLRHESLPDCMERIAAYFEEHMGLGPVE